MFEQLLVAHLLPRRLNLEVMPEAHVEIEAYPHAVNGFPTTQE